MSDRLIVPIVKPLTPKEGNTIRAVVDNDTLKELNEISDKTGIYISQLESKVRRCTYGHSSDEQKNQRNYG